MWTAWLLVRVAYRSVARTLEEILKHLTAMDASEVEMSTSLRLDRLAFREKTSVLKRFRPSLHPVTRILSDIVNSFERQTGAVAMSQGGAATSRFLPQSSVSRILKRPLSC